MMDNVIEATTEVRSWGVPRREPISKRLRFEILRRDAFCCQYCGRRAAPNIEMHIDHVIPVCDGGRSVHLNLVTACSDCNAGKAGNPISEDDSYLLLGRGMLCKRLGIDRDTESLSLMSKVVSLGFDVGCVLDLCRTAESWRQFVACIDHFLRNGDSILCRGEFA